MDSIGPHVEVWDEALRHILYEQMEKSQAFDSEVRHSVRALGDRNYQLLVRPVDRFWNWIDRRETERLEILGRSAMS